MGEQEVYDACYDLDVNMVAFKYQMLATQNNRHNVYIYVPNHKQTTFVAVIM